MVVPMVVPIIVVPMVVSMVVIMGVVDGYMVVIVVSVAVWFCMNLESKLLGERWIQAKEVESCITNGVVQFNWICIYIYIWSPRHGPWFGAFDLYCPVVYAVFCFLDFVSTLGWGGHMCV